MTSTAHELAASLDAALDTHEAAPGFLVNDLGSAEWAARKRGQIAARIREVEAIATDRFQRIEEWVKDATAADRQSLEHFDGLLTFYHQSVIRTEVAEGTADKHLTKSVKLPGLALTSRAKPDAWNVDEPVAIEWAKEHAPELVKTVEAFKLAEAKKVLTVADDGAVSLVLPPAEGVEGEHAEVIDVEGIEVVKGTRSFTVKPND